jgi:hypothetical protein
MGLAAGDYDNDSDLDFYVTDIGSSRFFENRAGLFEDVTDRTGTGRGVIPENGDVNLSIGWGAAFADLDNDGFPDIVVGNGHVYPGIDRRDVGSRYLQPKEVYRNRGDGTFEEIAARIGGDIVAEQSTRGLAIADYDDDGDIDIVAVNIDGRPSLYRNDLRHSNHWIALRLIGVESNRDGIGSQVEVESGGRAQIRQVTSGTSYLSHTDMRLHFGLGDRDSVERITIRWPSGGTERIEGVDADRTLTIREGAGIVGSSR